MKVKRRLFEQAFCKVMDLPLKRSVKPVTDWLIKFNKKLLVYECIGKMKSFEKYFGGK